MSNIVRNNPQIWRMAKWLHNNIYPEWEQDFNGFEGSHEEFKNQFYDYALNFLEKINNNEFTGPDNHE